MDRQGHAGRPGNRDARRGLRRVAAWVLGVLAVFFSTDAGAHRPQRADAWAAGLDRPAASAPAGGVRTLRLPLGGRVRIAGGTFTMGSTPAAMEMAIALCARESRGAQCHDDDVIAMIEAEGAPHSVTISTFEMDRTEVTVADFARCVLAGPCAPPEAPPDDARFSRGRSARHPRAVGRRGGVLPLGGRKAADRGRMGICSARARGPRISLGSRLQSSPGQSRLVVRRPDGRHRRVRRTRAGRFVPGRSDSGGAARHGGQRGRVGRRRARDRPGAAAPSGIPPHPRSTRSPGPAAEAST